MADFSEAALENVRTKDLGEVGDMLSSVVTELKSFDAAEEQEKGFFGFFKKNANKLDTMKNKYDKAEENGHENRESPPESSGRPHERHCNAGQDVRAEQNLFQRTFHVHSRRQEKASGGRENDLKELMEKAERSGLPGGCPGGEGSRQLLQPL